MEVHEGVLHSNPIFEVKVKVVKVLATLLNYSATNENLTVQIGQNFPYEDLTSKILMLEVIEEVNELLVVGV